MLRRFQLYRSALLFLGLCVAGTALADEDNPEQLASTIIPYLDNGTIAVAHVDVTLLEASQAGGFVGDVVAFGTLLTETEFTLSEQALADFQASLKAAGGRHLYVLWSLADFPRMRPTVIAPVAQGGNPRAVAGLLFGGNPRGPTSRAEADSTPYQGPQNFDACEIVENTVIAGPREAIERTKTTRYQEKPRQLPELVLGFQACGPTAAQLIIAPSEDNRRVLREMLPPLSAELGGVNGRDIGEGIRWAALGMGTQPEGRVTLTIQSSDAAAAGKARNLISGLLRTLANMPKVHEPLADADEAVRLLTPEIEGDRLLLALTEKNGGIADLTRLVEPSLAAARRKVQRSRSMNHLKQLALAMFNFHDRNGSFPPPASYDDSGNQQLSWRVYVLPYLEQGPLYQKFHLDEPWDSEHNRKLIPKMPGVFRSPLAGRAKPGSTTYQVPVGGDTKETHTLFGGKFGVTIPEITDGASNTIMIVDVAPEFAVPWTKPDDVTVDFENPLHGVFSEATQWVVTAFADGSARTLERSIPIETWRKLFAREDGQPVGAF